MLGVSMRADGDEDSSKGKAGRLRRNINDRFRLGAEDHHLPCLEQACQSVPAFAMWASEAVGNLAMAKVGLQTKSRGGSHPIVTPGAKRSRRLGGDRGKLCQFTVEEKEEGKMSHLQ